MPISSERSEESATEIASGRSLVDVNADLVCSWLNKLCNQLNQLSKNTSNYRHTYYTYKLIVTAFCSYGCAMMSI